jgi:prephenate dehydrogenase
LVGEVVGFGRSARNLEVARERGLVDRIVTDDAAAADADVIVLAAPVQTCAVLAERFARHARPTTVVTDVASVKGSLVTALEASWRDPACVVGAHPIAGSEASGAGAARDDLFRERLCVLTPTARTGTAALGLVRALWEGVGAHVETMTPETHDAILARISHLPHVLAYALVRAVADRRTDGRRLLDYAGTVPRRDASQPASRGGATSRSRIARPSPRRSASCLALDDLARLIAAEDGDALSRRSRARRPCGAAQGHRQVRPRPRRGGLAGDHRPRRQ